MLIKAKSLIPKTAKKLDLPEEQVSDVVNFYYAELRKEIEQIKVTRIRVPILGVFYFSKKKLESSIETLTHLTETKKPTDFKGVTVHNDRLSKIEEQKIMVALISKEKLEYDERKKNMESKKSNS
jgi:hypothetical protein